MSSAALPVLHSVADAQIGAMATAFRKKAKTMQLLTRQASLEQALAHRNLGAAITAIPPWTDPLFETHYLKLLRTAGKMTADAIEAMQKAAKSLFDGQTKQVLAWAKKHSAELVVELNRSERAALRNLIRIGLDEGLGVGELAKLVRGAVGLTQAQGLAVLTVRRGAGQKKAEAYERKLLKFRSETIARTETLKAVHAGQDEAWRQLQDQGMLTKKAAKQWLALTTACPVCSQMDGQIVPVGQAFMGGVDYPPQHPRCRCTVLLVKY